MKRVNEEMTTFAIEASKYVECPHCGKDTAVFISPYWEDTQSLTTQECENCYKEFELYVDMS